MLDTYPMVHQTLHTSGAIIVKLRYVLTSDTNLLLEI